MRVSRVLVVNAGSSSLKLRMLEPDDTVAGQADLPAAGGEFDPDAVHEALSGLGEPDAVGHRVVHGGSRHTAPVRIDDRVREDLRELVRLAPLHQPAALAGIAAVDKALPGLPAVACFDTAFHATLPAAAATYPLPAEWAERYGLRRYGFHGLSHAHASRRAAELGAGRRVVTCHLGAGASLAAVDGGRSVDTTMGFTPMEGLVMATRSGTVDPGLLLWLQQQAGLGVEEVAEAVVRRGGLLALAGTADMREVLAAAGRGEERAELALAVYTHRLRAGIAAMAAALGGLDALVFTGGIGENAAPVRERAAAGLGFLGVAVDPARNAAAVPDAEVTAPGAAVRTLVLAAREDLEIAAQTRRTLAG
jgi:acetate kinase